VVCGYSDITSSKTACLPHRSGDLLPPTLVHLRDAVARMALAMREEVAIMLPLVRPGLAAVAIFTATQAWNESSSVSR
jgi:hypothetical protein